MEKTEYIPVDVRVKVNRIVVRSLGAEKSGFVVALCFIVQLFQLENSGICDHGKIHAEQPNGASLGLVRIP